MTRRSQPTNQKIAINAAAVDHPQLDQAHLDHPQLDQTHLDQTHLDHHQQLHQLEQQLQQQQQHLQQQQQEQFQQQHLQLQQQENHILQADDDDEEEDEEEQAATDPDEMEAIEPPVRTNGAVGRNVNLTNAQRKAICQKKNENPEMTLATLGIWARKEFSLFRKPAMGTLSRIIHKKEIYGSMNNLDLRVQRKRAVLCLELDEALLEWVRECQERDIHVSYRMITKKGRELGAFISSLPGREDVLMPSFSNGWVSGFTRRKGLVGAALNSATATLPMPADEDKVSESFRPFSTHQELVDRVGQRGPQSQAAFHEDDHHHHLHSNHGDDMELQSAVSDMHTDLHNQVIHAVAQDIGGPSTFSTTKSAVPDMPEVPPPPPPVMPDTPIKKPRARKARSAASTIPRRGKAAKTTEDADAAGAAHMTEVTEVAQQHFQQLTIHSQQQQQQQQQQHQMHPAAPGLSFRSRTAGSPTESSSAALLANPLAHPQAHPAQTLHHLQFSQALLPATSLAGTSSATSSDLVAAVTSEPVASTSTTTTATTPTGRPVPPTSEVIAAIQIVINAVNVSIPAEVDLFKPLFDMERRLKNELHASERQANILNWSK